MREKRNMPKVLITLLLISSMGIGTTAFGESNLPEEGYAEADGVEEAVAASEQSVSETQAPTEKQTQPETQAEATQPGTSEEHTEAAETGTSETPGETAESSGMQEVSGETVQPAAEQTGQSDAQGLETQATEMDQFNANEIVQNTEAQVEETVPEQIDGETVKMDGTSAAEQMEEIFTRGYASTSQRVAVYNKKEQTRESFLGTLEKDSVVYALGRFGDGTDENEWLHILFAVEAENPDEQPTVMEGYLQAKELEPSEETDEDFVAQLPVTVKTALYRDVTPEIIVPVSNFKPAVPETEELPCEADEETEVSETESEQEDGITADDICRITANWEGDALEIGDQITLTALNEADDQVEWQVSKEEGVWEHAAQGQVYTFELTEENYSYVFRAVRIDPAE